MSKTKILIVDDSVFMRKAIEGMIKKEADLEIVGIASNGKEAVELAASLKPDIITLDIEMPVMDGLSALKIIMKECPTSVIMVSSLTREGADAALQALDMGAADFIAKDSSTFGGLYLERELKEKIRKLSGNKVVMNMITAKRLSATKAHAMPGGKDSLAKSIKAATVKESPRVVLKSSSHKKIVVLGTSTGGPQSLQKVIPLLPADLGVPIVITQHMPPNFTASLAARLDSLSKLKVVEAQGKEKLEPNVVYIAKGGQHLVFKKVSTHIYTDLVSEPSDCFNIPSVDVMASSIAKLCGKDCLGIIMTGMGSDGTEGMREIKQAGGLVLSQDEESCVIYGMPRAVAKAGLSDEVVPLQEIADRIVFHCKR